MAYHSVLDSGKYTGFFVDFIEEWSQFFTSCNWYTFRPFLLELEWDKIMGGVEGTLVILGIGFRLRWNYLETQQAKEVMDRAKEFTEELTQDRKP